MTNPVANEFVLNAVSMTNTQCAAVYLIHRLVGMLLLLVITELNSTSLVGRTEGIVGIGVLVEMGAVPHVPVRQVLHNTVALASGTNSGPVDVFGPHRHEAEAAAGVRQADIHKDNVAQTINRVCF